MIFHITLPHSQYKETLSVNSVGQALRVRQMEMSSHCESQCSPGQPPPLLEALAGLGCRDPGMVKEAVPVQAAGFPALLSLLRMELELWQVSAHPSSQAPSPACRQRP